MGKVAIGHDQTVLAYDGLFAVAGTSVDGHKFANGGTIANMNGRVLAIEFEVLGYSRNNSPRKYSTVLADPGPLHDGYVRPDPGTFADLHILVNDREGIDLYVGRQPGIRVNIGVGMNHEP